MSSIVVVLAFINIFILVLAWIMPALAPVTLPFGVRIPFERKDEAIIGVVRRDYHTVLLLGALAIAVIAWPLSLIFSSFPVAIGSVFAIALVMLVDYVIAHQRLLRAQEQGNWYAGLRQVVMASTDTHESEPVQKSRLSIWIVLNVIILLAMFVIGILRYPSLPDVIATHFDANGVPNGWTHKNIGVFMLPVMALLLSGLLFALARYLPAGRVQIDPNNVANSQARSRQASQLGFLILTVAATFVNVLFFVISLLIWQIIPNNTLSFVLIMVFVLVFVLTLISISSIYAMRARKMDAQDRFSRDNAGYVARDDNRFWKLGMFYVNHDDPSLIVEKRFGIGWTINFGHPLGALIMGLLVGVPVIIALLSAFLANK